MCFLSPFDIFPPNAEATVYNNKQIQIKLGWALFVTYTIIQSIMRSEMCSLHLTHPSVHTWSSGQPTVQRPGSSRGLPVGAGIRTHNLGLHRVSSPRLYPLGQRLPNNCLYNVCVTDQDPVNMRHVTGCLLLNIRRNILTVYLQSRVL